VVVGCFKDLYIFCRNGDNLIVIDQHAAHERLLYEDLRKQYLQGRIASQNLLFPVTLELTVHQSQLVEANLEELEAMGFSIRDFGDTTWVVSGVPALAGSSPPQELLLDILAHFAASTGPPAATGWSTSSPPWPARRRSNRETRCRARKSRRCSSAWPKPIFSVIAPTADQW